ncbi:hypothetical protein QUC31_011279 [Theobroma cacao]|uniref:Dof zinc finger protein n=2 Tax=Theobroma cacao TaxID=3641 RepID=A0AB32WA28_THECC|nr:PREDICTED: dof zinc finger protein DOF2.4 [Theobroma cacao]EOY07547.1 DNA binding with one finger 2.4, putative [Theobroma cacao]WRX23371.1 zinc finger protein [Theobroma cacao]
MVFTSIPAYLDPANWQQHPNHQPGASSGASAHQLPPPPPPPPPPQPHGGGGAGSIRPGSMADRARMANIPMPEVATKCPRCESTNTKFCYFNNYSLTQPRHFCKTCRRYWTRGGALRNVPVGGGCRRNKRSKAGSSSKSPVSGDRQTASGSSSTISSNSGSTADILGLGPQLPPLRFMAPLHHLSEFGGSDIGLNYGTISAPLGGASDLTFQIGSALASGGAGGGGGAAAAPGTSLLTMSGLDQWRLQQQAPQFPFLGGLESSSGLYQFESGGVEPSGYGGGAGHQVRPKISSSSATQLASVKMEDNNQQELNLSRQFLGVPGNDQYWSGTAWTDLSSFSSSSTSNPL